MASTSTTTQTQTTTAAVVTQAAPAPSTPNYIASIFCQHFTPSEAPSGGGGGGGGSGEGGGGGGGGGGQPQQPQQQQNVAAAADVKAMGKLPEIFNGDRAKAKDFIKEVKGYLDLNQDVAGFDSSMKKVVFTLTLIKGPTVGQKTVPMFSCFAKIEVEQIKKIT